MNTTPTPDERKVDRAHAETTIWRTATAAFAYYAGKEQTQAGYTIDEDIKWCLQPLSGRATPAMLDRIYPVIAAAIIDPTAHRDELTRTLAAMSE